MISFFFYLSGIFAFSSFVAFFYLDDKKIIQANPDKEFTRKELNAIKNSIGISAIVFLLVFVVLWFVPNNNNTQIKSNEVTNQKETNQDAISPVDVSFKVLEEDADNETFGKKRLTLELNKKVSEKDLVNISKKIRKENEKYKRVFIFYLLEGMELGKGGWAYVHFTPEMEVKISGLTIEGEIAIKKSVEKIENRKGAWIEQSMATAFVLFEKNGLLNIKMVYKDGGVSEDKIFLKEKIGNKIKFYVEEEFKQHGEYYVISDNGNLEFYNKEDKKFATAQSIK